MMTAALLFAASLLPDINSPKWQLVGSGQKSVEMKEGRQSLKLEVKPGTELAYQQIRATLPFTSGSQPVISASVEVRSHAERDGVGSYLALEFVNAQAERLGIAHSQLSHENGRAEWTRLNASMKAPQGSAFVYVNLILHAHGTAWFARPQMTMEDDPNSLPLATGVREVSLEGRPVTQSLIGLGFHCFHHTFPMSGADFDLAASRWKELNPGFVRINHQMSWTKEDLDRVARYLTVFQSTGAQIYICTWDPPKASTDLEFRQFAKRIADDLEYWIVQKKLTSIKFYCMSNEMSLQGWGALLSDLSLFKRYHDALFQEFSARKLKILLLATDASPVSNWGTIEWAQKNMSSISGAYGGHHYFNDLAPSDLAMAPWWENQIAPLALESKRQSKPFIIGEFGPKQDGATRDGVIQDRCVYFETPEEPMAGLQAAEAMIAGLRAGADAIAYWTFMDFPDDQTPGYANKWGVFRNSLQGDRSFRAPYYSLGLLTRSMRPGMAIYKTRSSDPRIRSVAAVGNQRFALAIINRNPNSVEVKCRLPFESKTLLSRYDPRRFKQGSLEPVKKAEPLAGKGPSRTLTLGPGELLVLEGSKS